MTTAPSGTPGTPPGQKGGSPPPPPPKPKPLTSGQQSVYDLMAQTLASWGLSTLANDLRNFIIKGDTNPDTLSLELSQTKAYKQRFVGNEERAKNGLPELRPAEYIALEEGYNQVLRAYGLPAGFYDQKSDFTKYIANDLSVNELQTRVQIAHDQYIAAPDYVKNLWSQYFGTKGDMIAAILDPTVGTQLIADRGTQVGIGGAAAAQGLSIDQPRAQQFQQAGVTLENARKAYAQIAVAQPTDQSIAKRFGTTFDQTQEENDLLLGQADAGLKRQTLYGEEESLFKQHGGASAESIGVSQSY